VRGGRRREIRIELIRSRLEALSIHAEDISAALARENRDMSAGDMQQGGQEVVIRTEGEYRSLEEIGRTVIAWRQDRPVLLREVADVKDGVQEVRDQLWVDETPGIRVMVSKQSGANTVEVVKALRTEIDIINADFAGKAEISMLRDSGKFIEDAVSGVQSAALLGGGLAVLVLLVFLRDFRTTMVVATTIPLSILATLTLMLASGITLNLISFGGLALGIGMLVDNAIVIVESIHSKREQGLDPKAAAVEGTSAVASAVVAGTLTTVAVFVPVVFLGGFAGVFFRELAVVVCFSLVCSLMVALTLVPAICAHWLGPIRARPKATRESASAYGSLLRAALRRPWSMVVLGLGLFLVALAGVPQLRTELMPEADEGRVVVSVEMPVGTPLATTSATMLDIADRIRAVIPAEEIEHLVEVAGPESWWKPAGSNKGSIDVLLVERSKRSRDQVEIIDIIQAAIRDVPGAAIQVRPDSGNLLLRMMRGGNDDRLIVQVIGHDQRAADLVAAEVREIATTIDGIVYARADREAGQLERTLVVDRVRLGELGLGAAEVASTVEHYVLGRIATRYRELGEEYDMRVVLRESERARLDQLDSLPIALPAGGSVPLGQVARIEERVGKSSLAREDQARVVKIGMGIGERDLGSVARDLQAELDAMVKPDGISLRIAGELRQQQESFDGLWIGGLLALFLVYAVMVVQFEKLRDPLVVMASIPFAIVGVIAALLATGTSLNLQSALGVIVLVGIVVNNAIVLVDHIETLRREEGMPLLDAVRRGSVDRLRPVLMTTATTLLGLVPLGLGLGEGSELQVPLARAVLGGLTTSTLVTLVLIPCLYYGVERWIERRR